ncbi:DUF1178 family protein [Sorlinia euscelidii]|uniref:DUF1178 domain-containing protein n=1 Tax=Sorlinia euscelidii TaxID=3081148 RepID=A0ABU7U4X7_9PROT
MISFELRCAQAHAFDGWFLSTSLFAKHRAAQLVACPHCGTTHGSENFDASLRRPSSLSGSIPVSGHLRAALRRLQRVAENHCENVGRRFAEAALRRHEFAGGAETISRGIYRQASSQKRDISTEKGIKFLSIPWGPIDDA